MLMLLTKIETLGGMEVFWVFFCFLFLEGGKGGNFVDTEVQVSMEKTIRL